MRIRESGMPDEAQWATFFSPTKILAMLGLRSTHREVIDFGCGYGTFAVPSATIAQGPVHAIDIDPAMVEATRRKADQLGIRNLVAVQRDFVAEGTGLPSESADYAMLFNILHAEERGALIQEAFRALRPGGILAVIHWQYDPSTPRGPSMSIRARPEQCVDWCRKGGFVVADSAIAEVPLYHYGFIAVRPQ
jgi:ubiquinone/menaquinone biosynthesis C-methylase UbiE